MTRNQNIFTEVLDISHDHGRIIIGIEALSLNRLYFGREYFSNKTGRLFSTQLATVKNLVQLYAHILHVHRQHPYITSTLL